MTNDPPLMLAAKFIEGLFPSRVVTFVREPGPEPECHKARK
jgi:hypothetical protein